MIDCRVGAFDSGLYTEVKDALVQLQELRSTARREGNRTIAFRAACEDIARWLRAAEAYVERRDGDLRRMMAGRPTQAHLEQLFRMAIGRVDLAKQEHGDWLRARDGHPAPAMPREGKS